jgi:hypothetical protein
VSEKRVGFSIVGVTFVNNPNPDIPADIAAAIDGLERAAFKDGATAAARAALDAAILARLAAAEAERDRARGKLDAMFGQLMLAEGSCAKLRKALEAAEIENTALKAERTGIGWPMR